MSVQVSEANTVDEVLAHLEATAAEEDISEVYREFPLPLIAYHDISTSESEDSANINHSSGSEGMVSVMAEAERKKEKEEGAYAAPTQIAGKCYVNPVTFSHTARDFNGRAGQKARHHCKPGMGPWRASID